MKLQNTGTKGKKKIVPFPLIVFPYLSLIKSGSRCKTLLHILSSFGDLLDVADDLMPRLLFSPGFCAATFLGMTDLVSFTRWLQVVVLCLSLGFTILEIKKRAKRVFPQMK